MDILNLVYINMVKEAQEELKKIWIPNVGDFIINENGLLLVLTNNTKQAIMIKDDIADGYMGVSLVHNGKLESSLDPIWVPRLDQVIEFTLATDTFHYKISRIHRWLLQKDNLAYTSMLHTLEEIVFSYYMEHTHYKKWNFKLKTWEKI